MSLVALVVLIPLCTPAVSFAQSESTDAIHWQGTVKYTEIARSPEGHRVKNIETRFGILTPLVSPTDINTDERYYWSNVTLTYADSGRWHYDEHEVDGGTVPETDMQWSVSDTLAIPSERVVRLSPGQLHTNRGDGSVQDIQLPVLPVYRVGSKVLVQPNEVGLRLEVTYTKRMDTFVPVTEIRDRGELRVLMVGKQPPHVPGEGMPSDETPSEDYAGLPPEIAAQLKMMAAMSGDPDGEMDDDEITIMNLKMIGFVDFDWNTVSGSREWTTTAEEPGDYGHSQLDDQTRVSHKLVWEFVPAKGK